MKRTAVVSESLLFSLPIEQELLKWARYMRQSNELYIRTTIWGKKQKREAEIYARVFGMVEERIQKEIGFKKDSKAGDDRG